MSKKRTSQKRSFFGWGMLIYAVVFLVAAGLGLRFLWNYMIAFEASRPQNVIDAYMDTVTQEKVCDASQALIDAVDHRIQSEEACREYVKNAVSAGVSYAKKSSESTETRQVYVLRSAGKVIGQFAMEVQSEDSYGFARWEVVEEHFDLSFLLGSKVSVTAPSTYAVSVNGVTLNDSYLTGEKIPYEALEDFYDDYDLPAIVTYEAGPFLGDFPMEVRNPAGELVTEEADPAQLDDNCTEEEIKELDEFIDQFLKPYVDYMGSSNKQATWNYNNVMKYVVKDSEFASRLKGALYGQNATQSKGDTIQEVRNNFFFRIDEGYYMCDVTYLVETIGKQGAVVTTNNVRILIVETNGKLLVQSVRNYS